EQELLEISQITKKEFNSFKLQLHAYFPSYQNRDRKDYVLKKIYQITEEFELGMEFYHTARKIMYKFWKAIKSTKDDVIAGVVCSIIALCDKEIGLKVNAICSHLGIQMSTIQRQVEHNVFNRLRIRGFTSLVRSSELLKNVMVDLGLVEPEEEIFSATEIVLGKTRVIYNVHDDEVLPLAQYLLAVETTSGTSFIVDEKYPFTRGEFVDAKHIIECGVSWGRVIKSKHTRYENPKGPPESISFL
ncbi:MAG: hypothetical protein ACTSXN_10625, partial [Promethearchaeota archaeon]